MMSRRFPVVKIFILCVVLCVASLIILSYYVSVDHKTTLAATSLPPTPTITCQRDREKPRTPNSHGRHGSTETPPTDPRLLIFAETPYSQFSQTVVGIVESVRFKYRLEVVSGSTGTRTLPSLTHADRGRFSVIIFERLETYVGLDSWNRQLLDKYCRDFDVGMILFAQPDETLFNAQVKGFPLFVHSKLSLRDYAIDSVSSVLRVTRAGQVLTGNIPGDSWTVFIANHSTYAPLTHAKLSLTTNGGVGGSDRPDQNTVLTPELTDTTYVPVIEDRGLYDGIRRVLFGSGCDFWLHKLLLLDSVSFLSHGHLSQSLDRYLLIDIDDIFVGRPGSRMLRKDVLAMIESQNRLQEYVTNFKFNLGFSGKYFRHGTPDENDGDDALIEYRHHFWWFGHSYSHTQAHTFSNLSAIQDDMLLNQAFAKLYDIPVNMSYSIAPHHAGVYPVHEDLFEAWKQVWDVKVTSTEEYPHLRPARHRRGFIHHGIMVLPRQTCGLFTHTIFIDKFPGGRHRLERSIHGGELFQTILYNQVSIFMTHLSNYGNDRLALYTFESIVRFINCWTNLRLQTVSPLDLAHVYFKLHPEERDPVWQNPCDDKRHMDIWSDKKSCDHLPDFLVIGPQKTGTTALYSFLLLHPSIVSNLDSDTTYEEVQFFNGKNYLNGLDWYLGHFPLPVNNQSGPYFLFEKSAGYFDSELAPRRVQALLPRAKLICILAHPSKRAYSWYQHMRSHEDPVALSHSFYDVITAGNDAPRPLREIKRRCLHPGLYAQHLERWLDYYDVSQIHIVDGEVLRANPVLSMNRIQDFLGVEPFFDYSQHLKFNPRKGFFCQVRENATSKCLGSSKGRVYPPMDAKSESFLRTYFRKPNTALSKLLLKLGMEVPSWLEDELSDIR